MQRLALPVVALVAFGLRVWGITFGLPAIYRPDENVVVGRAVGVLHGAFDPRFADWPHLYFYVSAGWLSLLRPISAWLGPDAPYLSVRMLGALLGTATIVVAFMLAQRAYGRPVGLLAALFLALAYLHVRDSHFATIDVPLTFAVTVALYFALRLAEAGTRKAGMLAAFALGLAAGVKYNGSLTFAGIGAAVGSRLPPRSVRTVSSGALQAMAIALMGIAIFAITSPFLIIDFGRFQSSLGYIFQHLSAPSSPEIGWVRLVRLGLWYGLDPPLFLLSLAGALYAAVRRTPMDWIFLAFLVAYYGLIGIGHTDYVRYADPLLPVLVVLAARFLAAIAPRFRRSGLAFALGVALVGLPALVHDVAFDSLLLRTDTRTEAFDWLASNVPAGARVAELYYPGPSHDQALIDGRSRSYGATDSEVASFLQNRLQGRYSVHELTDQEINTPSLASLRSDGVDYVVLSSPTPQTGCGPFPALSTALDATGPPQATFEPTTGCPNSVFDTIDAFFLPLDGYTGWIRPGPPIKIYRIGAVAS